MVTLLVLFIWVGIPLLIYIFKSSSPGNNPPGHPSPPPIRVDNKFRIRVRTTQESIEGVLFNLFVVEMCGMINAPYANYNSTEELLAFDVTDGDKKPLISAIDVFQLTETVAFGFVSNRPIPYTSTIASDWIYVVKIPIDVLTPPRKGYRKIRFIYQLVGTNASATTEIRHEFLDEGYLDAVDKRREFDALAITLAFAVCASDGEVNPKEAAVIKEWISKRVDIASEQEQESLKTLLNETIRESFDNFKQGINISYSSLSEALKKVSSAAERYEVLELGLQVAAADGIAEKEELELLDELAGLLDVDHDKFRAMRDKHLSVAIMSADVLVDVDSLLGLRSDMSIAEKKEHLLAEYKKWNQLVEHNNSEKREQAKAMLNIIAQKRVALTKEYV
ncbi:MAG: TerB family tellurite resistance protein [Bacteroidales bacterium]|nr:TerB family tellurite resistance protein [Bacteroidales bacterium]